MTQKCQKDEILSPSKLAWRNFKKQKLGIIGSVMLLVILIVTIFVDILTPYDYVEMHPIDALQEPCSKYLLGTDQFGRDQLSRLLYGTRITTVVSLSSVLMAMILGVCVGLVSGYYGGWIDHLIMRLLDIIFAFPMILLALILVAVLGPSLQNLMIAIAVIYQARFARIVRGSVLSIKEKEFVEAIQSAGAKDRTVIFRFILPNTISPVIVQATFNLSEAIMIEAALSFLGLGVQPPTPSWALMLNESRSFMELAPWLAIYPGLAIVFAVLTFNIIGDALRDALDPRLSFR